VAGGFAGLPSSNFSLSGLGASQSKLRRLFDAAIAKEDGGECLHPLTMEGYTTEHLLASRAGA
jgi:hypothetical protein